MTKNIKKELQQKGWEMRYSQDPCPRWVTHKWEDLTRAEFSLRSKGSASHISTPSPGAWH